MKCGDIDVYMVGSTPLVKDQWYIFLVGFLVRVMRGVMTRASVNSVAAGGTYAVFFALWRFISFVYEYFDAIQDRHHGESSPSSDEDNFACFDHHKYPSNHPFRSYFFQPWNFGLWTSGSFCLSTIVLSSTLLLQAQFSSVDKNESYFFTLTLNYTRAYSVNHTFIETWALPAQTRYELHASYRQDSGFPLSPGLLSERASSNLSFEQELVSSIQLRLSTNFPLSTHIASVREELVILKFTASFSSSQLHIDKNFS